MDTQNSLEHIADAPDVCSSPVGPSGCSPGLYLPHLRNLSVMIRVPNSSCVLKLRSNHGQNFHLKGNFIHKSRLNWMLLSRTKLPNSGVFLLSNNTTAITNGFYQRTLSNSAIVKKHIYTRLSNLFSTWHWL